MLYPELFRTMERARWNLAQDIPWSQFDRTLISERQLFGIKMNCILEWSAMPTAEMFLRDNSHDTDFAAFISIWFFEEQKHSLVLQEYLQRFAPELVPSQAELAAVRFPFDPAPSLDSLALHYCGELRLNHWYRCARGGHTEPVIRHIYDILSKDEARHGHAYFEYMKRAIERYGNEARLSFSKIGLLMSNPRINKALHPTNLHVNKERYPQDTVNSQLPDPSWLQEWLTHEIKFDQAWEKKVTNGILAGLSALLGVRLSSPYEILAYKDSLQKSRFISQGET